MLVKDKKTMTLKEFDQLEETNEVTYELIDSVLLISPRPNFKHQRVLGNLCAMLHYFLYEKECKAIAGTEIQLGKNVFVPDIFVYCDSSKFTSQRHIGAPIIVAEIISHNSEFIDEFNKLNYYAQYGVNEYWIVKPENETVRVWNFSNKTIQTYEKNEVLLSAVFDDLKIDLVDIFNLG